MKEAKLKAALSEWRDKLDQEITTLTARRDACDAVLATLAPDSRPPGARENEMKVAALALLHFLHDAGPPPAPASPGLAGAAPLDADARPETAAAHAPSPPPPLLPAPATVGPTPEELAVLTEIALTRSKHGYWAARVEVIIALDCGNTFNFHHVAEAHVKRYGELTSSGREAIASSLWKVARRRGYRVVRPGRGTTPTLYSKQVGQGFEGGTARATTTPPA